MIFLLLYEPFWIEEADVWRVERTNEVNPRAHVRFLKVSEFNPYFFQVLQPLKAKPIITSAFERYK